MNKRTLRNESNNNFSSWDTDSTSMWNESSEQTEDSHFSAETGTNSWGTHMSSDNVWTSPIVSNDGWGYDTIDREKKKKILDLELNFKTVFNWFIALTVLVCIGIIAYVIYINMDNILRLINRIVNIIMESVLIGILAVIIAGVISKIVKIYIKFKTYLLIFAIFTIGAFLKYFALGIESFLGFLLFFIIFVGGTLFLYVKLINK